jgi:hypothetical protein
VTVEFLFLLCLTGIFLLVCITYAVDYFTGKPAPAWLTFWSLSAVAAIEMVTSLVKAYAGH